jgi:hypothetical protein
MSFINYLTPVITPVYSSFISVPSVLVPRTFTVPIYNDLNNDENLRMRVLKHFYNKLFDKWLYSDFKSLLKFLYIKNDRVYFISDIKELEKAKPDDGLTADLKIDYIKDFLVSKSYLSNMLARYTDKYRTNWYDLYNQEHSVKRYIGNRLKKRFLNTIKSGSD